MPEPYFEGEVIARWLKDGRKMKLLENFHFVDASGKRWSAPKGSVIDGASIPRILWDSVGGPFTGKYRRASVLHDVACVERAEPYQDVHRMFYEAMIADKTSIAKAKKMYMAVASFGPKWDENGEDLKIGHDEEWL